MCIRDSFYNSLKLLRIEPPMQRDELTKTLNELVSQLDSDAPHMLYWQSTRAVAHRMHAFPKGGKASLMAFSEPCGLDRQDHPYKMCIRDRDMGGLYAVPGLVDLHFHGCMGHDFCDGTHEAISTLAKYQAQILSLIHI